MSAPERGPSSPRTVTPGLISIITPSLNSAAFVAETLESIAAQDYPHIEHIFVDGGSTDGTLEIVARYPNTTVLTGKDRGAADAINRGFEHSHGEFMMWLNADDILLPGAISAAVKALETVPDVGGVYGDAWWIDEKGVRVSVYPTQEFDPKRFQNECFICQPASVVRSSAFDSVGRLDPDCDLTFDYEFWMRFAHTHSLRRFPYPMAYSRMHRSNKTLGQRSGVLLETFQILKRHYGYVPFSWIYAYVCHKADGRDQFFEPLRPSIARYFESLVCGLTWNRGARSRYFTEWRKVMTWAGLVRRMNNL
jgi:glycosyltransferase involved in cell wall biosynthesis